MIINLNNKEKLKLAQNKPKPELRKYPQRTLAVEDGKSRLWY